MFLRRLTSGIPGDLRSNVIHYYFDIGWWGLYGGATAAFLTIYAARIGATPQQIGLLSAIPAALTLLIALPFGSVVRRITAHRAAWIGAFFQRLLFLSYALLPFFFAPSGQVTAILAVAVLSTIPTTLVGIGFGQLFIEAIPSDWRGTVVSVRNALYAVIAFVFTIISGQILTHLPFPANYQVVFVIGFIGGIMTAYHISRVRPLPSMTCAQPPLVVVPPAVMPPNRLRFLPVVDEAGKRYMRILVLLFLFNSINSMVAPLVPEVLVHHLGLSDGWISTGTATTSLLFFAVSLVVARMIRRTGNRTGTAAGALLLSMQAILLAVATHPLHYLLSTVFGGLGSGMLNTAQFNYHLENVPASDRSAWLSWNLLLSNAALLVGALVGPLIGGWLGVGLGLAIFGVLRLAMGAVIWKMG